MIIHNDAPCPHCGLEPTRRTCDGCGVTALITDCGDMPQPRPISADGHRLVCDGCACAEGD